MLLLAWVMINVGRRALTKNVNWMLNNVFPRKTRVKRCILWTRRGLPRSRSHRELKCCRWVDWVRKTEAMRWKRASDKLLAITKSIIFNLQENWDRNFPLNISIIPLLPKTTRTKADLIIWPTKYHVPLPIWHFDTVSDASSLLTSNLSISVCDRFPSSWLGV